MKVYYGRIANMVAEVSALEMPAEWLEENGFEWCVMPVGDLQYDTEFCRSEAEAKELALDYAKALKCQIAAV
jgi:hypothetical protein